MIVKKNYYENVVFISLIPNVIEAMLWLIDECFFICKTYYIQQKRRRRARFLPSLPPYYGYVHTYRHFSTLYTQEIWNMINLLPKTNNCLVFLNHVNRPIVEHDVLLILLQIIIPSKLFSVWLWHLVEKHCFYFELSCVCEVPLKKYNKPVCVLSIHP